MVCRLVNIPTEKINYDRKLSLIIVKFSGYERDLILKLVRKHRWVRNFKKITTLEK